jgi:stress-induced morphogen
MSTEILGQSDSALEAVIRALVEYESQHPSAEIVTYRHSSVAIRIRIVDSAFAGKSRGDRHDTVWQFFQDLPLEIQNQISILLPLTPDEKSTSPSSIDFDQAAAVGRKRKRPQGVQQKVTSTILRVYLLDKSARGKEEGIIKLCDSHGKVTQTELHFDSLDDIPDKIRKLLDDGDVKWPR